jgi:tetratricopeptide (TPR) repeat protein
MLRSLWLALLVAASCVAELPPGFDHFYNLEHDAAISAFQKQAAAHPDDPNVHNWMAQAVQYREMFRAGALESELVSRSNPFLRRRNVNPPPEAVKLFDYHIAKSIELSQARVAKDANDAEALYTLGVAHGLRANYNFLVRKAWRDALRDITAARRYHNKVVELDPKRVDARKMLGFIAGVRGDKEEGIRTLRLVGEKGNRNKYDAQVLLAAVYRRERRAKEAVPLLDGLIARFPRNYLFLLEKAQMYGDLRENDNALAVLETVERMKMEGAPGFGTLPLEKVWYYKGNVLFWSNRLDQALNYYARVTPKSKELDLGIGVIAWMRTGQIHDLKGNRAMAVEAYKRAVALAPQSKPGIESKGYISSPYRGG